MRDFGAAKSYDLGRHPTNSLLALFPGWLIIVAPFITYSAVPSAPKERRASPPRILSTAGLH
jgi:hypothetical protein